MPEGENHVGTFCADPVARLSREDEGLLTFEYIVLNTALVVGTVGAVSGIRDSINAEAGSLTQSIRSVDQMIPASLTSPASGQTGPASQPAAPTAPATLVPIVGDRPRRHAGQRGGQRDLHRNQRNGGRRRGTLAAVVGRVELRVGPFCRKGPTGKTPRLVHGYMAGQTMIATRHLKVYVVDGDPVVARTLADFLGDLEYEAVPLRNPEELEANLDADPPQAATAVVALLETLGSDPVGRLRKIQSRQGNVAFILAGNGLPATEAVACGVRPCSTSPCDSRSWNGPWPPFNTPSGSPGSGSK